MFIPGIGAFIRLRQRPVDAIEDARIGLAGPIWGLGAALVALALGRATGEPLWLAIAKLGAWINLFNLLPILSLDGSRAFTALARPGRALATLAFGAAWYVTGDGLLILLALVAGFRVFGKAAEKSDTRTLVELAGLIASLAALSMLPVKL
jgi:Zn-dependent protease